MEDLPDLDRLSVTEKDNLIRELWPLRALVRQLSEQVAMLTAKVADLKGRLAKNSRNSSKPPSSDGLNRPKPKSQRKRGQKPNGGQQGHAGHTLKKVAEVDHIETHAPPVCDACGARPTHAIVVETRQVFDLPPLRHALHFVRCDQLTVGLSPTGVRPCRAHMENPTAAGFRDFFGCYGGVFGGR